MSLGQEKTIVLIGFMGVGKTTVGKLIAEKLNRDFIDIDVEIEQAFGIPVTQIFQKYGEKAFREKEKALITSFSKKNSLVLSLGGGAFLQEDIRRECLENSTVVFLELSWDAWKKRIALIQESRPVLHGKSLAEMEELFYQRQEIYQAYHYKISTDNKDSEVVACEIVALLEKARQTL